MCMQVVMLVMRRDGNSCCCKRTCLWYQLGQDVLALQNACAKMFFIVDYIGLKLGLTICIAQYVVGRSSDYAVVRDKRLSGQPFQ